MDDLHFSDCCQNTSCYVIQESSKKINEFHQPLSFHTVVPKDSPCGKKNGANKVKCMLLLPYVKLFLLLTEVIIWLKLNKVFHLMHILLTLLSKPIWRNYFSAKSASCILQSVNYLHALTNGAICVGRLQEKQGPLRKQRTSSKSKSRIFRCVYSWKNGCGYYIYAYLQVMKLWLF